MCRLIGLNFCCDSITQFPIRTKDRFFIRLRVTYTQTYKRARTKNCKFQTTGCHLLRCYIQSKDQGVIKILL